MKEALCGANCAECPSKEVCPGCAQTNGCPFGKECNIAKYILTEGMEKYQTFKKSLIDEINALHIAGMEEVAELYPLVGNFVNLEYPLPSGETVKFLRRSVSRRAGEKPVGRKRGNLLRRTRERKLYPYLRLRRKRRES